MLQNLGSLTFSVSCRSPVSETLHGLQCSALTMALRYTLLNLPESETSRQKAKAMGSEQQQEMCRRLSQRKPSWPEFSYLCSQMERGMSVSGGKICKCKSKLHTIVEIFLCKFCFCLLHIPLLSALPAGSV